jgi:hypothetical protein
MWRRDLVLAWVFLLFTRTSLCADAQTASGKSTTGWESFILALIAAAAAFGGSAFGQRVTAKEKRRDEQLLLERRLGTLRGSLRAELTQLIDSMKGEKAFVSKPEFNFTWLPVRDYFETFRTNKDLIGLLHPKEVESLTSAMHVFEERIGYLVRKAQSQKTSATQLEDAESYIKQPDLLGDLGPPIGRNIRLNLNNKDDRDDVIDDLESIIQHAQGALSAINSNFPERPPEAIARPAKRRAKASAGSSES